MSNPRKNPPTFNSLKSYEQWRKELNGLVKLTKEAEEDWARLIALRCLSPDDPSGIRDKVFALNLDPDPAVAAIATVAAADAADGVAIPAVAAIDEDKKAGFNRLMEFMDKEFQKDSLTDMCEHIRAFMKMVKGKEQTMKAYISNFEAAYKKAKEKGLPAMPPKFMMWSLLESVNISDPECMLVLTGIPADSRTCTRLLRPHFSGSSTPPGTQAPSARRTACLWTPFWTLTMVEVNNLNEV